MSIVNPVRGGLALSALLLTGCTSSVSSPQPGDSALLEAGFRYLFEHNSSALQQQASAFCIDQESTAATDPALVAALADVRPRVLPATACTSGESARVKATGATAVIFSIGDIQCASAERCSFRGGYYEANLSASSGRYLAQRIQGRWVIRLDPNTPQAVS